jgi:urease accessory protein
MRARAWLDVELDGRGHSVVRRLRSAAPLMLVPARDQPHAVVRLVNSAAAPLAGDALELTVRVGSGARLTIAGVAAMLALPGRGAEPSRFAVHIEVAERAAVAYLPEPTVITGRARHESHLHAELAAGATLRCREVLVLGRAGERPGRLSTATHVLRDGCPLLRQRLEIGDPGLDASVACLAGRRVLATEILIDDRIAAAAGGDWWSRTPLAAGGSLATALADDAVTALRGLHLAHPPVS